LLIPDRKGNKLVFGLQNILMNPKLVSCSCSLERGNGASEWHAELTVDPAILKRLSARGQPANVAIRVTVRECFFHCAKAFLRSQLWQPEAWQSQYRISFGKLLAEKAGGDDTMAQQIDQFVEQDYKTNL